MMGRQSRQMAMVFVDIESLIPETHLLRKIERMVSFNFIYDLLAPYYPATGRPSVDPVSMFKMLLIGYLYGIKSERRLVEEVQLNIAYRWFCGFELDDTIPNHSTFSKTRTRKWQQSNLFQKAFYEIVKQCIDSGLIDGEAMAADGSYIPANVSRESWIVGTPEYLAMMRLRKIWAEGSFSVLKREHCISRIRKRGILAATEECLLAAMALNLKRMAKCHLSLSPNLLFCWNHCGFLQNFCFCQQVPYLTLSTIVIVLATFDALIIKIERGIGSTADAPIVLFMPPFAETAGCGCSGPVPEAPAKEASRQKTHRPARPARAAARPHSGASFPPAPAP